MYYFRKNGKTLGPFNVDKLRELAGTGMIERTTEISDDKIYWKRADAFREIFPDEKKINDQIPKELESRDDASYTKSPLMIKASTKFKDKDMPPQQEDMPPSANRVQDRTAATAETKGKLNYFELFWNPMEALPMIYVETGDKRSAFIGIIMIVASSLSFFCAIKISNGISGATVEFSSLLIAIVIPFASMISASFITRTFLGAENPSGGFGGDCLISGSAFLLVSLSVLISAYMMKDQIFFQEKGVFISGALFVYAYTSSVLILYAGSTAISGVPKSVASIVVPLMIVITAILSGLIFRLLIMKQQ